METVRPHAWNHAEEWAALRAICAGSQTATAGAIPLGLEAVDAALPAGGLSRTGVHEWIGSEHASTHAAWTPPLCILSHLAHQAVKDTGRHAVWIGEAVWPHPPTLAARGILARCLFVRAGNAGERLWASDLALRSGAVALVIGDGSRFDVSATRRLQLAAEAGGVPCLLARPPRERAELSAATTRWHVGVVPAQPDQSIPARRWTVELLRCKGVQPASTAPRRWILEQPHATGDGLVARELFDRPGDTAAAPPTRRSG
ncbi:MAG: hypothetical protein QM783_16015 [Phycisphaerales bacterium]